MNLILFEERFESMQLDAKDPRAEHIRRVLRARVGTLVFVGFENGPRARARVVELGESGAVRLELVGEEAAPAPLPITLLVGLPRPHTAKRILFEAASLGVRMIHFFEAEKGEPSYAQSSLWSSNEWKQRIRLGVEQSFGTHVPEVAMYPDLQTALNHFYQVPVRVALDNYEAGGSVTEVLAERASEESVLAFGPERGWSDLERIALRQNGWKLAHLGPSVLRAETAVVAGVSAVATSLQLWGAATATEL